MKLTTEFEQRMDEQAGQTAVRNPYTPPNAPVADPPSTQERGPPPIQVSWAVRLFWLDLVLSVVQAGRDWDADQGLLANLLADALSGLLYAFEAWVILKISAGQNWARWVALICVVVGVPLGFLSLRQMARASWLDVALDGVATCADVIALSLIFLSSGRRWFQRKLA